MTHCQVEGCPNDVSVLGERWCIEHMDAAQGRRRAGLVGVMFGAGKAAECCQRAAHGALDAAERAEGPGFPRGAAPNRYAWPTSGIGSAPEMADKAGAALDDADRVDDFERARAARREANDLALHGQHRAAGRRFEAAADAYGAARERLLQTIQIEDGD